MDAFLRLDTDLQLAVFDRLDYADRCGCLTMLVSLLSRGTWAAPSASPHARVCHTVFIAADLQRSTVAVVVTRRRHCLQTHGDADDHVLAQGPLGVRQLGLPALLRQACRPREPEHEAGRAVGWLGVVRRCCQPLAVRALRGAAYRALALRGALRLYEGSVLLHHTLFGVSARIANRQQFSPGRSASPCFLKCKVLLSARPLPHSFLRRWLCQGGSLGEGQAAGAAVETSGRHAGELFSECIRHFSVRGMQPGLAGLAPSEQILPCPQHCGRQRRLCECKGLCGCAVASSMTCSMVCFSRAASLRG